MEQVKMGSHSGTHELYISHGHHGHPQSEEAAAAAHAASAGVYRGGGHRVAPPIMGGGPMDDVSGGGSGVRIQSHRQPPHDLYEFSLDDSTTHRRHEMMTARHSQMMDGGGAAASVMHMPPHGHSSLHSPHQSALVHGGLMMGQDPGVCQHEHIVSLSLRFNANVWMWVTRPVLPICGPPSLASRV